MQKTSFKDLSSVPGKIAEATRRAAANTAHVAELMKRDAYPGINPV